MFEYAFEFNLRDVGFDVDEYWVTYTNGIYNLNFIYVSKDGRPVPVKDPTDRKQVAIWSSVVDRSVLLPVLRMWIKKKGSKTRPFARYVDIKDGWLDFQDAKDEKGMRKIACQSILEANKLVEELFPGFEITDKKTY